MSAVRAADKRIYNRPIKFVSLAGGREIGRHSHYLSIGKLKILVDPGVQANGHARPIDVKDLHGLNFIFLTHAHLDHIGSLIDVMLVNPHTRVCATRATRALASIILKKSNLTRGRYSEEEIDRCINRIKTVHCEEEIHMGKGIYARFIDAGHILGSASIVICAPEGNIMITGDFATEDRGVLFPFRRPDMDLRALITEGSLVGLSMPSAARERDSFMSHLRGNINEDRNVVVAATPLGVFQEYAMLMPQLQQDGLLPSFPIFLNANLREAFKIYLRYYESLALAAKLPKESFAGFMVLEPLDKKVDVSKMSPFCLIAGPSNLKWEFPNGFVRQVIMQGGYLIADNRYTESLIYRRVSRRGKDRIKPEQIMRMCSSNHVTEPDLNSLIDEMRPHKTVFVHGMPRSLRRFARELSGVAMVSRIKEFINL
ncbi:MAG: MBL fold metallo-hydrolase [Candidatus Margulisbacteria bacterium]|nr:MBL fold metallo-hydrolase [Candidatus Margulisiibacteriota bacterium]